MKRLVSYIYKYSNGKKGENVGYGKIDTIDNRIKLNISLRCTRCVTALKVYFFIREESTKLVYIGEAKGNGNIYELRSIIDIYETTKGKYKTSDIYGLAIVSEKEIVYISYWKEEYKIEGYIMWNEKPTALEAKESKDEAEKAQANKAEDNSVEVVEEDTIYLIDKNCVPVEEAVNDEKIVKESVEEEQVHLSQFFKENVMSSMMLDGKNQTTCSIKPMDIYMLPRKCWEIVRNAYVCHGFMRYGQVYLIERNGLYIGVCGYKTINEEIIAKKYGFDIFMEGDVASLGKSSNPKWSTGLWCRRII